MHPFGRIHDVFRGDLDVTERPVWKRDRTPVIAGARQRRLVVPVPAFVGSEAGAVDEQHGIAIGVGEMGGALERSAKRAGGDVESGVGVGARRGRGG